jgi:hypothetical protein
VSSTSGTIDIGWRVALLAGRITPLLATCTGWWTVCVATCASLLAPLFLVDVPPVLGYPTLSRMYAQHSAIIPNLAIDLCCLRC